MDDRSIRLDTLDLLQVATPQFTIHAKRNRSQRCTDASPETALRFSANSVRHYQNRETFLILLLWLCCLWEVGAVFARLFL